MTLCSTIANVLSHMPPLVELQVPCCSTPSPHNRQSHESALSPLYSPLQQAFSAPPGELWEEQSPSLASHNMRCFEPTLQLPLLQPFRWPAGNTYFPQLTRPNRFLPCSFSIKIGFNKWDDILKVQPEEHKIKKKSTKTAEYCWKLKPRFILTKHLINPVKYQSLETKLTPLDLLIGLPVNGFKAPCGPSPSFCASYFNRIFSYISLSLFLSLSKCLLVTKDREDIARVEALARKAIPATIFYEMQNMRVGRFFWDRLEGAGTSHWARGHLNHRHFWRTSRGVELQKEQLLKSGISDNSHLTSWSMAFNGFATNFCLSWRLAMSWFSGLASTDFVNSSTSTWARNILMHGNHENMILNVN